MKLIFNDEFQYEGAPDAAKWDYDLGDHGWGNDESQNYTDSLKNAFVKNGKLYIVAKKTSDGYTSARLVTRGKFSFQYGRIEVSAKLPRGVGSWPAIWMLPDNINEKGWPLCGEIDIMEHVGKTEDTVVVSLHSQLYNHVKGTQRNYWGHLPNACNNFNTYICQWDAEMIEFYYNNEKVARFEKKDGDTSEEGWPFDQKFHLILNIAVGGSWGGPVIDDEAMPFVFEIDHVRVYQ